MHNYRKHEGAPVALDLSTLYPYGKVLITGGGHSTKLTIIYSGQSLIVIITVSDAINVLRKKCGRRLLQRWRVDKRNKKDN